MGRTCLHCGYSLEGIENRRACPECGEAIAPWPMFVRPGVDWFLEIIALASVGGFAGLTAITLVVNKPWWWLPYVEPWVYVVVAGIAYLAVALLACNPLRHSKMKRGARVTVGGVCVVYCGVATWLLLHG